MNAADTAENEAVTHTKKPKIRVLRNLTFRKNGFVSILRFS